jgi:hypothetical protein
MGLGRTVDTRRTPVVSASPHLCSKSPELAEGTARNVWVGMTVLRRGWEREREPGQAQGSCLAVITWPISMDGGAGLLLVPLCSCYHLQPDSSSATQGPPTHTQNRLEVVTGQEDDDSGLLSSCCCCSGCCLWFSPHLTPRVSRAAMEEGPPRA